jgi:hypothetical protein
MAQPPAAEAGRTGAGMEAAAQVYRIGLKRAARGQPDGLRKACLGLPPAGQIRCPD